MQPPVRSTVAPASTRRIVTARITGIVAEIVASVIATALITAIVAPVIEPAPACPAKPLVSPRTCFHPLDLLAYAILVLLVVAGACDGPRDGIEGIGLDWARHEQATGRQKNR